MFCLKTFYWASAVLVLWLLTLKTFEWMLNGELKWSALGTCTLCQQLEVSCVCCLSSSQCVSLSCQQRCKKCPRNSLAWDVFGHRVVKKQKNKEPYPQSGQQRVLQEQSAHSIMELNEPLQLNALETLSTGLWSDSAQQVRSILSGRMMMLLLLLDQSWHGSNGGGVKWRPCPWCWSFIPSTSTWETTGDLDVSQLVLDTLP